MIYITTISTGRNQGALVAVSLGGDKSRRKSVICYRESLWLIQKFWKGEGVEDN